MNQCAQSSRALLPEFRAADQSALSHIYRGARGTRRSARLPKRVTHIVENIEHAIMPIAAILSASIRWLLMPAAAALFVDHDQPLSKMKLLPQSEIFGFLRCVLTVPPCDPFPVALAPYLPRSSSAVMKTTVEGIFVKIRAPVRNRELSDGGCQNLQFENQAPSVRRFERESQRVAYLCPRSRVDHEKGS